MQGGLRPQRWPKRAWLTPVGVIAPNARPGPPVHLLELDLSARRVCLRGQAVMLHDRAFDLLATLAGEPGRIFAVPELTAAVWPGRRMEGNNLRMQVRALRLALGPSAVLNVAGRGYRLGLPVRVHHALRLRGNLPHWGGELLGRETDLAALQSLLLAHRLVTVVGPGGIGKTRVAQHLARHDEARHRDGSWWVDLARLSAGPAAESALPQAIAQTLNLQTAVLVGPGAAASLASALAHWQGLVLLDNAEHLAGDSGPLAALLRTLLEGAPGLQLLVTSQQTLQLPEEWVYRLGPLAVPKTNASPQQTRSSPAIQLLARRAAAADQGYALADADLPAAGALVRRLDGIALAIELAAARLPMLGMASLLEHLSQRLDLLGGTRQGPLARHGTLRAALAWSHGLLTPAERLALHSLSVFEGPFRPDTGARVVAGAGIDEAAALRTVFGLADKSLLQLEPGGAAGAPSRLRMLDSTRLFAAQALEQQPPQLQQAVRRRHVQAMAELAAQAKDDFYRASDAEWSARWVPDHADLQLAFDRAASLDDADAAGQIIELLVLGANATGRVEPALPRAAACGELARRAQPLARARLLGWGNNTPRQGQSRVAAAKARVEVWRAVASEDGQQGLCVSLGMLALACEESGDRGAADAALAECRELECVQWPARLRRRCSWIALSRMAILRDDAALRDDADRLSRQLMHALGELGAWRERSIIRTHQAQMLRLQGRPAQAAQALLDISREQLALGWDIDAGVSLGLASAALVEAAEAAEAADAGEGAEAAESGATALAPHPWHQARVAAEQALAYLAPLPALLRHFVEPLARLACECGDPFQAALLLAGGERLRRDHQNGHDPLSHRMAQRVKALLDERLAPAARARAQQQGHALDSQALRLQAWRWLRQQTEPSKNPHSMAN